ncbi:MAG: protein kinase [Cyanobacteria bacterium SZAS-4]|nr:protein kinase [Cyanobacteria bacterium SZAS-4]
MDRLKSQNSQPDSDADESTVGSIYASKSSPVVDEWILSAQQTQPGDKIGKYEVINEIGRGGMSIVYKARDHELNRLVAVKLMLRSSDESLNLLRFQKEARAASQLDHPNIVKVHDFSTTPDGTPYLVMSYLDGISLADAIKTEGSFSLGRWLSVMIQACDALEHAHLAGVVHRDIKPSNFVLAQEHGNEVLKLVDFGIATNSSDDMSLTKTGEIFGSPLYMSPEQCAGSKLDLRSDIYSLGCVMYEALAGMPPLSGSNSLSTLQKHLTDKPANLSKLKLKTKNIEQLDRIVMRCLEKNPDNRYQNLGDLKKDLKLLFQGQSHELVSSTSINVPVLVATALSVFVIFMLLLNFDKIADYFSNTADKARSDVVSKAPQSVEGKRAEWEKCKSDYQDVVKLGKFQFASVLASKLTHLAEELHLSDFVRGKCYFEQGFCEVKLKHPIDAEAYFEQALSLMTDPKTLEEREVKYEVLMRYGQVVRNTPTIADKAESIFQQALNLAVQMSDKRRQAVSLTYIGDFYRKQSKYPESLVIYNRALKLDPDDRKIQNNIKEVEQKLIKPTQNTK